MSSATSVTTSFDKLGLIPPLLARLTELEYQQPTPIQAQAIPSVLVRRDLIAGANTGSGKTATFALPLLQQIREQQLHAQSSPNASNRAHSTSHNKSGGNYVAGLVLVPPRELAKQVANSIRSYAVHLNQRSQSR